MRIRRAPAQVAPMLTFVCVCAVGAWPENERGHTYETTFCSFNYPSRFWRVREERDGLEIVLETLMGINARVWVDELTPGCNSMEYLKVRGASPPRSLPHSR